MFNPEDGRAILIRLSGSLQTTRYYQTLHFCSLPLTRFVFVFTHEEGLCFINLELDYKFVTGLTELDGQAVKIRRCHIRISTRTLSNSHWPLSWFSLVPPENFQRRSLSRTLLLPSRSFPIHQIILQFDAMKPSYYQRCKMNRKWKLSLYPVIDYKGPNSVGVSPLFTWGRKQIQFPKRCVL
jgi:hypothetical protein